jgi:hypothetical protein
LISPASTQPGGGGRKGGEGRREKGGGEEKNLNLTFLYSVCIVQETKIS